jgi:Zn-dependent protease/CBS domain-containing protein
MLGRRWQFIRLVGIPISVDASWLIILALLSLSLANRFPLMLHEYFPLTSRGLPTYEYWVMGLITALAFFGCILLHELGHAIVARARGMRIQGITLFLFGGVAEITDEPPSPLTEFLMAIAGPAVSIVLAVLFWLLALLGYNMGWPHPVVIVCGYLAAINGLVIAFNLVPAFPLDGGRVLRSILWGATKDLRKATYWASQAGQVFAWVLIGWGILQFFDGNWLGGVWMGLIGMFLNNAAQGGYQQVLIRQALKGEPVRRFMKRDPIAVPPSLDLDHWVEDYVYRYHHHAFPVVLDGSLVGLITTQDLNQVARDDWGKHTVGEVMMSDIRPICIGEDADAMAVLEKLQRTGASRLLVAEGDRLLGLISHRDLLSFLNLKLELEGASGYERASGDPDNHQPRGSGDSEERARSRGHQVRN